LDIAQSRDSCFMPTRTNMLQTSRLKLAAAAADDPNAAAADNVDACKQASVAGASA
jgi:hypothetical protein